MIAYFGIYFNIFEGFILNQAAVSAHSADVQRRQLPPAVVALSIESTWSRLTFLASSLVRGQMNDMRQSRRFERQSQPFLSQTIAATAEQED